MRLTKQTNYAIRMMMYCAVNRNGQLSRVQDVAKAYGVSDLFLFKILQPLVEAGFMESVRGRKGGVRLARQPGDITLYDVVRVTEESFAMAECFEAGDIDCPLVDGCALNGALYKALNAFFEVLQGYTIEDLVLSRPHMRTLLGMMDAEIGNGGSRLRAFLDQVRAGKRSCGCFTQRGSPSIGLRPSQKSPYEVPTGFVFVSIRTGLPTKAIGKGRCQAAERACTRFGRWQKMPSSVFSICMTSSEAIE